LKINYQYTNYTPLIFSLFIGSIVYLFGFDSFYFFDDTLYIRYANELSNGILDIRPDNFYHRWGLTLPTALLIKKFAINRYSTTLWSFFCWAGSVIIVNKITQKDQEICIWATFLCAFDFYFIFFCNKVYPDIQVAFFSFAAMYILSKCLQTNNYISNSFIFVFFCVSAFLSKTTFIYIVPGIIWIFISNYKNSHFIKFTISSFILGIISLFLLGYFYKYHTGDYLYIFSRIESNHYTHSESYFDKNWTFLLERLTVGPLNMFINTGMIIPFLLSIPIYQPKNWKQLTDSERIWPIISASILIMFWIGTLSLKFYHPMSLLPRMILMLTPFLAITAAMSYFKFMHQKVSPLFISILLIIIAIYCYLNIYPQKSITYILFSSGFLVLYLSKKHASFANKFSLFLPIILCLHPLYSAFKPKEFEYFNEKEMFENTISKLNGTLITDARPAQSFDYYFRYKPHSKLKIYSSEDTIKNNNKKPIYLLENKGFSNYFSNLNIASASDKYSQFKKIEIKKIGQVTLYKLQ